MFLSILKRRQYDERSDAKRWMLLVRLGLLVVVSVLLALAGPFGTFQTGTFFDRFVYWFALNFVSITIAVSAKTFVSDQFQDWSLIHLEVTTILITTLLFTPFLWIWTMLMFPGSAVLPPTILWMGCLVLLICVSISALIYGVPLALKHAKPMGEPTLIEARIVRRLPKTFDGKIIRLAVDSHVVRVITNVGTFELRMRFSDAILEVSELDGICVHRSHWVVVSEITGVRKINGRPYLLLSNGEEVPVSRKYQPDLELRGIL